MYTGITYGVRQRVRGAVTALFLLLLLSPSLLLFGCGDSSGSRVTVSRVTVDCSGSVSDDSGWLAAHNVRRQRYHEDGGTSYVPLQWSAGLASCSQQWAELLVDNGCNLRHCANVLGLNQCQFGENLARHSGLTQTADQILTRWTEDEEGTANDLHFSQVLWRPTRYVGCGWATGSCGEVQVCRYVKPGNCNLGSLNYLVNDSPCGPECPPEGCSGDSDQSAHTQSP